MHDNIKMNWDSSQCSIVKTSLALSSPIRPNVSLLWSSRWDHPNIRGSNYLSLMQRLRIQKLKNMKEKYFSFIGRHPSFFVLKTHNHINCIWENTTLKHLCGCVCLECESFLEVLKVTWNSCEYFLEQGVYGFSFETYHSSGHACKKCLSNI